MIYLPIHAKIKQIHEVDCFVIVLQNQKIIKNKSHTCNQVDFSQRRTPFQCRIYAYFFFFIDNSVVINMGGKKLNHSTNSKVVSFFQSQCSVHFSQESYSFPHHKHTHICFNLFFFEFFFYAHM